MDDAMKLSLTLPLILLLAACEPVDKIKYPREHRASYTCSIDQWEMVKRRIQVCEASGLRKSCPNYAIRGECTYKGDLPNDNSNSNQEEPTSTPD